MSLILATGPDATPSYDNRHLVEVAAVDLTAEDPEGPVWVVLPASSTSNRTHPGPVSIGTRAGRSAGRQSAGARPRAAGRVRPCIRRLSVRSAVRPHAGRGRFQGWQCHGVRGALPAFDSFDFPDARPRPLRT